MGQPEKAVVFEGRKKTGSDVKWTKKKTTKDHHYQQLARKVVLHFVSVKLDKSHLLRSALNPLACEKAIFWEEEEEKKVRCEMDQIKQQRTTTTNIGKEIDSLSFVFVTLDTSHWLMLALNAAAFLKAVVFVRRKKKGSVVKWIK